ncbi:hypothetical protein ES705_48202 [subsurface metagenome]
MKKNVLIKGILILIAIALLTIGFTGCGAVLCTTATVYITTPNDSWTYWIYIDGNYWGTTNWSGNMTLYGVPTGYHTFYALSNDWAWDGTTYATIVCGVNNVAIWTTW